MSGRFYRFVKKINDVFYEITLSFFVSGSKEHYLCDTEVNLCYSSPCENNGTCKIREGGYTCVCPESYSGEIISTKQINVPVINSPIHQIISINCTGKNCEIHTKEEICRAELCKDDPTCNSRKTTMDDFCEDCSLENKADLYTPFCELKSRSFGKNSFLTLPSLKQRHRLHIKMR